VKPVGAAARSRLAEDRAEGLADGVHKGSLAMTQLTKADDCALSALIIILAQQLSGKGASPSAKELKAAVDMVRQHHAQIMGFFAVQQF
jgi:hypothetical protein